MKDWSKILIDEERELSIKKKIVSSLSVVPDAISIPIIPMSYDAIVTISVDGFDDVLSVMDKIKRLPLCLPADRKEFVVLTGDTLENSSRILDDFVYQVSSSNEIETEKAIMFADIDGVICRLSIKPKNKSFTVSKKKADGKQIFSIRNDYGLVFGELLIFRYSESSINYVYFSHDYCEFNGLIEQVNRRLAIV